MINMSLIYEIYRKQRRVDLRKKTLDGIIACYFPKFASKAKEIIFDGIYAYITDVPTTAYVTVNNENEIEIETHETVKIDGIDGDKISGKFRFEREKDGSLLISKEISPDVWKEVEKIKPY